MKKFKPTQINLLNCLTDGASHSGNALGEMLHVSRTAIWKQIKQLIDIGVPIERIANKGYRLRTPITFLNEEALREQLSLKHFKTPIDFHLFASIDSTNRQLKEIPYHGAIDVCCAETQTAGRGRFGRHWHSPFGENIYCSSRWHFDCDLSRLSGLSLVVSLAILATLNDMGINDAIKIKWPNDLLWQHKKLCGSLIEVIAESNSRVEVIIGIGLNVNSATTNLPVSIDKPWCSLLDITDHYIDRNALIARLITQLSQHLQIFIEHGFTAFIADWHHSDYLYGENITVSHPTGALSGIAQGVNEGGQLILMDEMNVTHYLSSGDTSLHSMDFSKAV